MVLDGFWYHLQKQKWAFRIEGIAKIKLSCCLNEVETWLTSEMEVWLIFGHFEDFLGRKINQNWTWIATWIEEALESPWGIDFFECLQRNARFWEGFGGFWKPLGKVFGKFWSSVGEVFQLISVSGIFFNYQFRNGFLYLHVFRVFVQDESRKMHIKEMDGKTKQDIKI